MDAILGPRHFRQFFHPFKTIVTPQSSPNLILQYLKIIYEPFVSLLGAVFPSFETLFDRLQLMSEVSVKSARRQHRPAWL